MADRHAVICSELKQITSFDAFDSDKIKEYILSKNVDYDGKRVKWDDSYKLLQDFITTVFYQEGKWRCNGGNSKMFDASTLDFTMIWYPRKLNTLMFKGKRGCLAKECLINHCISTSASDIEEMQDRSNGHDLDKSVDDLILELDMLKSRVDSIQSLINSREDPISTIVSELNSGMVLFATL